MSHWPVQEVFAASFIAINTSWPGSGSGIRNNGESTIQVYNDLEIIRVRTGLADTTIIETLPGANRSISEVAPNPRISSSAPVVAIAPGQMGFPVAVVVFARAPVPDGTRLKVVSRIRFVDNVNGETPQALHLIANSLRHEQRDVVSVTWV